MSLLFEVQFCSPRFRRGCTAFQGPILLSNIRQKMVQNLQGRFAMGAGPENLSTFRAQFEMGLSAEDIYRNPIAYGFIWNVRQDFIARETAGQRSGEPF